VVELEHVPKSKCHFMMGNLSAAAQVDAAAAGLAVPFLAAP
jgi:hypothetical protein